MRPTTDTGSYDDVLQRRRDALRVRPPDPDPPAPPAAVRSTGPGDPYVLPVPGRHVSRRAGQEPRAVAGRAVGGVVAGVLPAPLRGRVGLGGAQLAVLAVVVAVALSVTAWWVLRADARAVEAPAPAAGLEPTADLVALEPVAASSETAGTSTADLPAPSGGATPTAAAGTAPGEVTVDVAGAVRRPGVVTLPAGARVVDALAEAGGARPGVDLSPLNLARVLVDGEQVLVGERAPGTAVAGAPAPVASGAPSAAPSTAAAAPVGMVDLNTADAVALEGLPEVGPVTAAAIVAWREENGGFTAVEELLEVDGIGEVTLAQIAPHATV